VFMRVLNSQCCCKCFHSSSSIRPLVCCPVRVKLLEERIPSSTIGSVILQDGGEKGYHALNRGFEFLHSEGSMKPQRQQNLWGRGGGDSSQNGLRDAVYHLGFRSPGGIRRCVLFRG